MKMAVLWFFGVIQSLLAGTIYSDCALGYSGEAVNLSLNMETNR